jgi:uncharacterized protein YktA (UPF0223 family)
MKAASNEQLMEVQRDFEQFKALGNSDLRAAYLASSGRGFNEIVSSKNNQIVLHRSTDDVFIFINSQDIFTQKLTMVSEKKIQFHNLKDF